jgi:hypothetical protein
MEGGIGSLEDNGMDAVVRVTLKSQAAVPPRSRSDRRCGTRRRMEGGIGSLEDNGMDAVVRVTLTSHGHVELTIRK